MLTLSFHIVTFKMKRKVIVLEEQTLEPKEVKEVAAHLKGLKDQKAQKNLKVEVMMETL